MRSRLPLFLNALTLEEILFLEDELDRRKEKYRRCYSVLAVVTDKPVMRAEHAADLTQFARDVRRYITSASAAGGGAVLAFSPEVSVMQFHTARGALKTCESLLSMLPELNGRYGTAELRFGVRLGLATGLDTIAPGSPRSVRRSPLVSRATGLARRSAVNTLLMDNASSHEWPDRQSVVPQPFDFQGAPVYRVIPGLFSKDGGKYNNPALLEFLRRVGECKVSTLKYDIERVPSEELQKLNPKVGDNVVRLILEIYDSEHGQNLKFNELIDVGDYAERVDSVKRAVNSMGLALVRHELSAGTGV